MAASAELLAWCSAGGIQINGIEAALVAEGYRGVVATADLPPHSCVLRVPRYLLLSVESARRDAQLQAALKHCSSKLSSEQVGVVEVLD